MVKYNVKYNRKDNRKYPILYYMSWNDLNFDFKVGINANYGKKKLFSSPN